jgi:ElaB/YqjD/DUF883 family membrane-anchored ribosome-binding protein
MEATLTRKGLTNGKAAAAQLSKDYEQFIGDVETLVTGAKQLSGDGAALARATLDEKIAMARSKLNSSLAFAGEKASETLAATEDHVTKHPMQTLAIALAAGALIGLLLGRKI